MDTRDYYIYSPIVALQFWMAPELLRGESLNTVASDVYSFGVILYEVYARKDPYFDSEDSMDAQQILAQICDPKINKRPPPPKDCPSQLASLMKDCMVARAGERPSFEEVDIRIGRVEARKQDDNNATVSLYDIFPHHIARALQSGKKIEPEHKESVTIFFSDSK